MEKEVNKMTIARIDNFSLSTKTYLFDKENQSTHDLEIRKWVKTKNGDENCYTIATFNVEGEIVSCCDRLLDSIAVEEDLYAVKALERIGFLIITETDNVKNT